MAFNWREFNSIKSLATDNKLKNLSTTYGILTRNDPPLRGFAVRYRNKLSKLLKMQESVFSDVFDSIKHMKSSDEVKNHLETWERFQMDQKGPAAPVTLKEVQAIIDNLSNVPFINLSDSIKQEFNAALDEIFFDFGSLAKIDPTKINYAEAWRELPNQTVRGFPYHALGENVDDVIIQRGGTEFSEAFSFFVSQTQNVCFPGWRIQGKPWPGPAKVRVVNIPSVSYQYLMVGLTKKLMSQLKLSPFFDGWKDEDLRVRNISSAILKAKSKNQSIIQLDYSAFDQSIHPYFRISVWKKFASLFPDQDIASKFVEAYSNYSNNQYLFMGSTSKQGVWLLLELPMQLLSGIIDTQLLGSVINGVLQKIVGKRLGYDLQIEFQKGLGDDALLPVPNDLIYRFGYVGLLEKISSILKEFGFKLNPSKAYPNTDSAFLQKLYVPDHDIRGVGSWTRNLSSFLFKERYTKPIKGITNLPALEIISQISIISQAFPKDGEYVKDMPMKFANWWIKEDKLLSGIICELRNRRNLSPNSLFDTLVKISGATYDQILEHMDLLSYDHTHLSEKLHSNNYAEVFPILNALCAVSESCKLVNEDLKGLLDDVKSRIYIENDSNDDILDD